MATDTRTPFAGLFKVDYFTNVESLARTFAKETGVLMPRMSAGRIAFFSDLRSWMSGYASEPKIPTVTAIPPDPTLGLSFPYPRDELIAAVVPAGPSAGPVSVEDRVAEYGLDVELLNHPVASLSAGERLLMNFVKADLLLPSASKLVICSPYQSLFQENHKYADLIIQRYIERGKHVIVLALQGEPVPFRTEIPGISESDARGREVKPVPWTLGLDNVDVEFFAQKFPVRSRSLTIHYKTDPCPMKLRSPTLCEGNNGIGKTTLARVLSGCISDVRGGLEIRGGSFHGVGRFVMQNTHDQLFGVSPRAHINQFFRYDNERRKAIIALFNNMQREVGDLTALHRIGCLQAITRWGSW